MRRSALIAAAFAIALLAFGILAPPAVAAMSTGDGGWTWLDPLPQGNLLQAVAFIDPSHAVAAGDSGALLTTSDAGLDWTARDLHIAGAHVLDLSFPDTRHGWAAVSVDGVPPRSLLLRTTDGGITWPLRRSFPLVTAVDFVNARDGWMCGGNRVWATRDGGRTWSATSLRRNWILADVSFVDRAHGWVVGTRQERHGSEWYPIVVATTDGGASWHAQHLPAGDHAQQTLGSIAFTDARHGCAVGSGTESGGESIIVTTTDGGVTWQQQTSGTTANLGRVSFVDPDHGWMTGDGKVFATTDGGVTWAPSDPGITAIAASFSDDLHGIVVGDVGGMATTGDGGLHWLVRSLASPAAGVPFLNDVTFSDAQHGWAVGGGLMSDTGAIMNTTDGGAAWTAQTVSVGLAAVSFPDPDNGWAVGGGGGAFSGGTPTILHTSDGGVSWQPQFRGAGQPGGSFTDVDFIDAHHGWAAGSSQVAVHANPIVRRTADGGATWTPVRLSRTKGTTNAVSFVGARRGWAVTWGPPSRIFRTTDGGRTWQRQWTTARYLSLVDVSFVDRLHGWAIGGSTTFGGLCRVLSTNDGGRTWSRRNLKVPSAHAATHVTFIDRRHGWIACGFEVLSTVDGGRHWRVQRPGAVIEALTFIDPSHGWAVANETADWVPGGGGILTATTGGRPR